MVDTEIICIIDRSGSMGGIADDAIGGFNTFLKTQKELPDSASLTLVLFNETVTIVHDGVDIKDVPDLDNKTYVPSGCTALFDAIGSTITKVEARHASSQDGRPGKVIVAILTDGAENSSREFVHKTIFDMIERQKKECRWEFMFLAANQDAFAVSSSMGISHALNYAPTRAGTRKAAFCMASAVSSYRCSGKVSGLDSNTTLSDDTDNQD